MTALRSASSRDDLAVCLAAGEDFLDFVDFAWPLRFDFPEETPAEAVLLATVDRPGAFPDFEVLFEPAVVGSTSIAHSFFFILQVLRAFLAGPVRLTQMDCTMQTRPKTPIPLVITIVLRSVCLHHA